MAQVCLGVGVLVLGCVTGLLLFPDLFLNGAFKARMERAFVTAHPTCALQIGGLHYNIWKNRFVCDRLLLLAKGSGSSCQIAGLSFQGLGQVRLLFGKRLTPEDFAHARISATNLAFSFPTAGYRIHCGRLWVTLADSQMVAEAIELRPLADDEQFFAARPFRRTRLNLVIPQCRVLGLASADLLQRKGYRARSIQIRDASLDAFLNRDKPADPHPRGPFTVREALAMIPQPLAVGHLDIINGRIALRERAVAGAKPGVLTFEGVRLSAEGISNQAEPRATAIVAGQARLMNASTLELSMEIPTTSPERTLRYFGSFSAMDLTKLNPFLEAAAHTRIKSGALQEAVFNIEVTAGQASGQLRALYQDLHFAFLDPETGSEVGLGNQLKSFLADRLALHTSNPSAGSDSIRLGAIDYTWGPQERILHFLWFALRSGIFNVLGLDEYVKGPK